MHTNIDIQYSRLLTKYHEMLKLGLFVEVKFLRQLLKWLLETTKTDGLVEETE